MYDRSATFGPNRELGVCRTHLTMQESHQLCAVKGMIVY